MNILKKSVGIILVVMAALLSLGTLVSGFNGISESIKQIKKSTWYGVSFTLGTLLGLVILITLIYFMAKIGLKLINKKQNEIESIDEIGIK